MATRCECGTTYNERTTPRCTACLTEGKAQRVPHAAPSARAASQGGGVFEGRDDERAELKKRKIGAKYRLGAGGTSAAMSGRNLLDENGRKVTRR